MGQSIFEQENFRSCFAAYIKESLLQKQISLELLAQSAHVSVKTLKRYVYGDVNKSPKIRPSTYHKILAALDTDHAEFCNYIQSIAADIKGPTHKPRYRYWPVLVLVFFSVMAANWWYYLGPEELAVRGRVLDESNNPVKGATISLSGYGMGTFSKTGGEFSVQLDGVKRGSVVSILISHPNYKSQWQEYQVNGTAGNLEVVLSTAN